MPLGFRNTVSRSTENGCRAASREHAQQVVHTQEMTRGGASRIQRTPKWLRASLVTAVLAIVLGASNYFLRELDARFQAKWCIDAAPTLSETPRWLQRCMPLLSRISPTERGYFETTTQFRVDDCSVHETSVYVLRMNGESRTRRTSVFDLRNVHGSHFEDGEDGRLRIVLEIPAGVDAVHVNSETWPASRTAQVTEVFLELSSSRAAHRVWASLAALRHSCG